MQIKPAMASKPDQVMKRKILFVDDEPNILAAIKRTVRYTRKNWDIQLAHSAEEALELLHASDYPDLIVCDVMMPGMTGFDLLQELQKNPETAVIPFIFLTGRGQKDDHRHGMELGADDYLVKPFQPDELLAAINTRLEKKEKQELVSHEQLEALRGSFILAMPHELRTPLSIVSGYADLLTDPAIDISRDELVEIGRGLSDAARRLNRLVENYLMYAQIEVALVSKDHYPEIREARVQNPGDLVKAIALARAVQSGREADFTIRTENALVRITDEHLAKIVEELIDNALKFSEKGTQVFVRAEPDGEGYTVEIEDKGRGMSREAIANIGAFMQFERSFHEQQGTGFGLVISRRLAELHGGKMRIEGEPQEFTRVTIRLQRAEEGDDEEGIADV